MSTVFCVTVSVMMTLAVVAMLLAAPSKGPAPAPAKEAQVQQNQATKVHNEPHANQQATGSASPALAQSSTVVTTGNQSYRGSAKKGRPANDWWEIVGTIARVLNTILLTLFSGALAILAYFQWVAMRGQRTLMRRQAVLMSRQLAEMKTTSTDTSKLAVAAEKSATATRDLVQVMQRAWISVEVEIPSEIYFVGGDLRVACLFTTKNVGRTVANKIEVRAKIVLKTDEAEYITAASVQSELAAKPLPSYGKTLFPDETDSEWDLVFADKREVEAAILAKTRDTDPPRIAPILVGCVVYEYPNSQICHVTRFAYMISRKEPGLLPPPPYLPAIEVGVALPPDQIEFRKFFWGGSEAD